MQVINNLKFRDPRDQSFCDAEIKRFYGLNSRISFFSPYQVKKAGLLSITYSQYDVLEIVSKIDKAMNSKSNNIELKEKMIKQYKKNLSFVNSMINQQILESSI